MLTMTYVAGSLWLQFICCPRRLLHTTSVSADLRTLYLLTRCLFMSLILAWSLCQENTPKSRPQWLYMKKKILILMHNIIIRYIDARLIFHMPRLIFHMPSHGFWDPPLIVYVVSPSSQKEYHAQCCKQSCFRRGSKLDRFSHSHRRRNLGTIFLIQTPSRDPWHKQKKIDRHLPKSLKFKILRPSL